MRAILNSSLLLLVLVTTSFFFLNGSVFGDIEQTLTSAEYDFYQDSKSLRNDEIIQSIQDVLKEKQVVFLTLINRLRGTFR